MTTVIMTIGDVTETAAYFDDTTGMTEGGMEAVLDAACSLLTDRLGYDVDWVRGYSPDGMIVNGVDHFNEYDPEQGIADAVNESIETMVNDPSWQGAMTGQVTA